MQIVWYILAHVSLGLIGYQVFTFTNIGGLYCALASAVIQAWPIWEIHRHAWPRFQTGQDSSGPMAQVEERRAYWWRIGRLYVFRISAFSILTLIVASLTRGG